MKTVYLEFLSEMQLNFISKGSHMADSFWNYILSPGTALAAVWVPGMYLDFNFNFPVTPP